MSLVFGPKGTPETQGGSVDFTDKKRVQDPNLHPVRRRNEESSKQVGVRGKGFGS